MPLPQPQYHIIARMKAERRIKPCGASPSGMRDIDCRWRPVSKGRCHGVAAERNHPVRSCAYIIYLDLLLVRAQGAVRARGNQYDRIEIRRCNAEMMLEPVRQRGLIQHVDQSYVCRWIQVHDT